MKLPEFLNLCAYIARRKRATREREAAEEQARIESEAVSRFNILRINGVDFITYCGVVITRPSDKDLLDRIEEFRANYRSARLVV